MEATLKRYNYKGGSYYFYWNFAAGIAYEEMIGDIIDNAKTTKELAAIIYFGTIEGMREVNQPVDISFDDFIHQVGMSAIYTIFDDVGAKKKRRRWLTRRKKLRVSGPIKLR